MESQTDFKTDLLYKELDKKRKPELLDMLQKDFGIIMDIEDPKKSIISNIITEANKKGLLEDLKKKNLQDQLTHLDKKTTTLELKKALGLDNKIYNYDGIWYNVLKDQEILLPEQLFNNLLKQKIVKKI
jgi:hypothetical protein